MKKLLLLLLLVPVLSISQTLSGKVVAIKDGDTVVVLDSLNNQTTLRLAEVDCPEKNQPFGTKNQTIHIRPNSRRLHHFWIQAYDLT